MMPKGFWTAAYIGAVVFINWLFVVVPMVPVLGTMFPPVMLVVGFVFVFRDFAQREVGHWVILAMIAAGGISYFMSAPVVAIASLSAFLVSEALDWAVYTFTRKPLAQRVLYSSALSVPVDTFVFLHLVGIFDWTGFLLVVIAKMVGALVFWAILRSRSMPEMAV
jgi:queuosine precursor transporter